MLLQALPLAALVLVFFASGCAPGDPAPPPSDGAGMDPIAEAYVKLVLGVGQHDDGYVDAYYGPAAWRDEVEAAAAPLDTLAAEADRLLAALAQVDPGAADTLVQLRHAFLTKQVQAVAARVAMLQGARFTFDEEAAALYDVRPPHHDSTHFAAILQRLDPMLPGEGPLVARYERFKEAFVIPRERLDTVFTAAIEEARRRTKQHVDLPEGESFVVEYVTDKSWSGYNWYQGDARSLIQVNVDLPIYVDRALDLAAHEGYPGHHVYNALLEQHLARDRGWVEFMVYPLFSPQSLIAEGSANYGIEVAFPADERMRFEREVLWPLAGLDTSRVDEYYAVMGLVAELSYAGNEAARRYLDGEIDAEAAVGWLTTYALSPEARARQRIRFFDTYRSYVVNYNLGQDLVRRYVEANGGSADRPDRRWEVFKALLSSPRLPSGLE